MEQTEQELYEKKLPIPIALYVKLWYNVLVGEG
jgi:hypothetical protein